MLQKSYVLVRHLRPVKMQLVGRNWQWVYNIMNIHMYHNQTLNISLESDKYSLRFFYFFMCVYVFKSFILETQSTYV